jgi:hypothetical protein
MVRKWIVFFLPAVILIPFSAPAGENANFLHREAPDSVGGLFYNAGVPVKSRIRLLNYSAMGLYAVSMSWLNTQWYKEYPRSSFHFFNDNSEWEQMDKFAHAWDAYNIAKPLYRSYRWAGLDNKKSVLYGAGIAFLFQSSVEVFDGFSSQWGFSGGDMLANLLGLGLFTGQQLRWMEQRISLKFSFHQTQYAQYRPDLLGKNLPENILKDYNGLTHWVIVNPASFFKNSGFPRWLSFAFGFGAEGMTGGKENPVRVDGRPIPVFERYKQYYFSLDVELYRIPVRSKFLSSAFRLINIIHLPAPAVEWSPGRRTVYRLFYF